MLKKTKKTTTLNDFSDSVNVVRLSMFLLYCVWRGVLPPQFSIYGAVQS